MTIQELILELSAHPANMEIYVQQGKGHYLIVKVFVDHDYNDSPDDYLVIEPEPELNQEDLDDDAICKCGHKLYLHDDGIEECAECTCPRFRLPDEE